jgi:polar amino acid transport system substrate-binding protein
MKIRTLLFILITLFLLLLAGCTAVTPTGTTASVPCNEAEITVVDGKPDLNGCVLRIAVENAYQPFNFIDTTTGEAVGYDYDIFNELCTRINCQPEFIETSWDAMVAAMGGEGGFDTYDIGADGITITEERAENVDFSIPYITSSTAHRHPVGNHQL